MRKNSLLILFLFIFLSLPFLINYAWDLEDEIKLYVGQVKILPVDNPTRIAIGNPQVIDVSEVTKDEITLDPKAPGRTTLLIWDKLGEHSYKVKVLAEDINEIKRRVDNLLAMVNFADISTQIAEDESKLLLLGTVKTEEEKQKINVIIEPFKDKIMNLVTLKEEEAGVEIDVQVLELNRDATNALGFSWPESITLTDVSGPTTVGTTGLRNVFHVSDFTRSAFNVRLDALIQEGKARILSRPRLSCQSGKEAELLVGGEKPIFTTIVLEAGGQGTRVEYKEFGIKLKIKPTIIEERIKLALNVEVSEVGDAEVIGTTSTTSTTVTAKAYPLTKRTASTELFLNDGQTMAIGGLMKEKTEEDIRKTPGLGDLPVLGLFFRKKTTRIGGGQEQRGNVELFITLTPKIVGAKKGLKSQPATTFSKSFAAVTIDNPVVAYSKIIQDRIMENIRYPVLAKEAGLKGKVKLSLHLAYNGQLLEAKVKESSGHRLLDEEAIIAAESVGFYPPFPSSITQKDLWLDIPVIYQLD